MALAPPSRSLKDILIGEKDNSSILILDGGVSTHLENKVRASAKRHDVSVPSTGLFQHRELWSSSLLMDDQGRELIREGHVDWIMAGSDMISTVTYQCHYDSRLWPRGNVLNGRRMDAMWADAMEDARHAIQSSRVDHNVWLVASSGCYGGALANGAEYSGDYGETTPSDIGMFHRKKLERIDDLKPDAVAIETIPSLRECRVLAALLNESILGDDVACWVSFACRNGMEMNDGSQLVDALDVLSSVQRNKLQAIGLNCCDGKYLTSLAELVVRHMVEIGPKRAIAIYPNSGEAWDAATSTWVEATGCTAAEDMAESLLEVVIRIESLFLDLAPDEPVPKIVIGGCCRTSPSAIAALRRRVDAHQSRRETTAC